MIPVLFFLDNMLGSPTATSIIGPGPEEEPPHNWRSPPQIRRASLSCGWRLTSGGIKAFTGLLRCGRHQRWPTFKIYVRHRAPTGTIPPSSRLDKEFIISK